MKYEVIFILLLIVHILGEFYFYIGEEKKQNKKIMLKYLSINTIVMTALHFVIAVLFNFNIEISIMLLINFSTYLIVRIGRFFLISKIKDEILYTILHIFHVSVIIALAYFYQNKVSGLLYGVEIYDVLMCSKIILAILLIGKPANETFAKFFKTFKPSTKEDTSIEIEKNTGKWIGFLERIIILLLFIFNAIGSVAIIIAAKTLTRYDRISKDSNFSEYYLLGTLYSLAVAFIVSYLLLNGFSA